MYGQFQRRRNANVVENKVNHTKVIQTKRQKHALTTGEGLNIAKRMLIISRRGIQV